MLSHVKPLRGTVAFEGTQPSESERGAPCPSISIVVPTLNEAENIDETIGEIIDNVYRHFTFEIIVTDGGSTDGTCEKVQQWQPAHPVSLIQNGRGGSLAEDVLSAAAQARFSIVVVLDADGSHPAPSIKALVDAVASSRYDMAIGSRYVDGGATVGWPFYRNALSRLGAALASPFTDVKDPLSGFFAILREQLLDAGTRAKGFKIGLETLFAGGDSLNVCEVPISFFERQKGKSKIGGSQFAAYLSQLIRFCKGTSSFETLQRFSLVGLVGFFLDLLIVASAQTLGADIMVAHIWGFCVATVCNYVAHAHFSFRDRPKGGMQLQRFVLVGIMALAMRGGAIATTSALGLPMIVVLVAGIIGGGIVSYIGNDFYVFRGGGQHAAKTRWRMATVGLVCYVVALRLLYQGAIDLMPQEAYYWRYAQYPAWGYFDHPPMVAWLIWLGTAVFGDTEFGVRIGATLCWLVTAYFAFRFADGLFGRMTAFLTLLLLSVLPFFFMIGTVTTPDAPLTAAWAGALYFLQRAILQNRPQAWLRAGVCIGLGMLSKYTIALLGPATLVFLVLHPMHRRGLLTKWPYLGAVLAFVLFSPVIAWNARHDWASFQFQGSRRWAFEDLVFSTPSLLLFIAILLGPVGLLLGGAGAGRIALLSDRFDFRGKEAFLAVFTLVPLFVFTFFSLFHSVKMNWTGPVWLSLLPVMANVVETALSRGTMPRLLAAVKAAAGGSVLFFAILFHYLALGLPLVGYTNGLRGLPIAWEEFVSAAEDIETKVAAETGSPPLLVGMDKYNVASELGFYSRGRTALNDITSRNLFGESGLMFEFWQADRSFKGRSVIMYGVKEDSLSTDGLPEWFESIGPVERRTVYKDRAAAGQFFYRIGYGFRKPSVVPGWSEARDRWRCSRARKSEQHA
ncbi:glycosyltransferase family 39 protein [Rhizobium mongolense]|uniref:glycosyltransferase family 39 protein n=1 Tax=Rhizobium mongolense TaxID=57676 RepID=UPI003557A3AC